MISICFVSCGIVIIGILVSSYYLHEDRIEDSKACKKKDQRTPKYKENDKLFRLQYEIMNAGIRNRDSVTIVAGTVLITASLLLLTSCIGISSFITKVPIISCSLAIYIIWLIGFDLTTKRMNAFGYSRLRKMEGDEDFTIDIHTKRLERVKDEKWWKYIRRKIWLLLLWVLIISSIAILSIPPPV